MRWPLRTVGSIASWIGFIALVVWLVLYLIFREESDHVTELRKAELSQSVLNTVQRDLLECQLELATLLRTRDIRIAQIELERTGWPEELKAGLSSPEKSAHYDERSKVEECESLRTFQSDLLAGASVSDANDAHVKRLVESAATWINDEFKGLRR